MTKTVNAAERILRRLEAPGYDVVERPKLGKRPVAFRVPGKGIWHYFNFEEEAVKYADKHGTTYRGLYVRDGT